MWGSACEDRGKALLSKPWEPAETLGSAAVRACKESRCFHCLAVPSFQSNLQLLGGQVFNRGGACGTFQRQKLQL